MRVLFWAFLFTAGYLMVQQLTGPSADGSSLPYSAFREEVANENVVEVTIQGDRVRGILRSPVQRVEDADTTEITDFVTWVPSFGDADLLDRLEAGDVEVVTLPQGDSSWLWLLVWAVLPIAVIGGLILLMARRMGGRAQSLLSIGKSGARKYDKTESATTFDDVAGAAGAKRELQEIVQFLRDPSRTSQ